VFAAKYQLKRVIIAILNCTVVFAAKYQLKRVIIAILNYASFHSLCCIMNRKR